MSDRSRILRGGARAATGLVVVATCAVALALLGTTALPEVVRAPLAITVDTTQNASRSLVCAGSFAELGADTGRPGVAIPSGAPSVTVAGSAESAAELTREEGGAGLPGVFSAPLAEPLAAAQVQRVDTENLRGVVAGACADPLNEQWLLGGATTTGISTTLSLGNPGSVPATVRITVFDENGAVESVQSTGVLVAPGAQQIISLNGYAPDRERLAVRVESTGAPITASLGVGQVDGISPFAASAVTRQSAPGSRLVLPGIANESDHEHGPSDSGEGDEFPVVVRALAPDGASGTARLRAVDREGGSTELGVIDLAGAAVGELRVAEWPEGANALIVESDVPVLASALGSSTESDQHDYEWFVPAPELATDEPVAAALVTGARLVLVNPGAEDARVEIARADGEGRTATETIPAGAAVVVRAPGEAVLTSTAPLHAGARVLGEGTIAGYPVLAPDPRDGELTVHTR